MSQSDYLVLAAPLTKETFHVIDEFALAHAKKGQVLINLGRGQVSEQRVGSDNFM
jgi:phosphoglycerate dehydrogenase-like enzyme